MAETFDVEAARKLVGVRRSGGTYLVGLRDYEAALDEIERLRALVYIPSAQERDAVDRLVKACVDARDASGTCDALAITNAELAIRAALRAVEAARAK